MATPHRLRAGAGGRLLLRVAAAPGRVLGAERPAALGTADPQSQQVPLARWVRGVVDECRPGVHGHEVADELQVTGLELHAKGDAWPLGQRIEVHEAGDLV